MVENLGDKIMKIRFITLGVGAFIGAALILFFGVGRFNVIANGSMLYRIDTMTGELQFCMPANVANTRKVKLICKRVVDN